MSKKFYGDVLLKGNKSLQLEDGDTNIVSLKAPAALSADYSLTMPSNDGDADQLMSTDGSGNLSFIKLVDANVDAGAAIAYSKLSLSGEILNGDLAGSIADGKLAQDYIQTSEVDDSSIEFGSSLNVKALGITNAMLAGSIESSKISELNLTFDADDLNYEQGNASDWTLATNSTIELTLDEVGSRLTAAEAATNVSDAVYGVAWDGDTSSSASKNAIYDKIELLDAAKLNVSLKGAANGLAELDASSKLPASQLPVSAMEYKGAHNVSTNTPTLIDGTGTNGDMYRVSVGGSRDYGSGSQTFAAGDAVIYNGTIWEKIPGEDLIQSVNSQTGVVVLDTDDISEGANKYYASSLFDSDFSGKDTDDLSEGSTNFYYTEGRFDTSFGGKDADDLNYDQGNAADWTLATGSNIELTLDEVGSRLTAAEAASNVNDAAYGVAWDADTTGSASRNALYDKFESLAGTDIDYTPAGDIAASNVEAAINELDSEKEPSITATTSADYYRGDKTFQTLDTDAVPEGSNKYYSNAQTIGSVLTAYSAGAGTVSASDSILEAIEKLDGNIAAIDGSNQVAESWTSLTSKTVTHNFSTTDVLVQVFDIATGESVEMDSVVRTANTVVVTSSEAASGSGWRVLVLGF